MPAENDYEALAVQGQRPVRVGSPADPNGGRKAISRLRLLLGRADRSRGPHPAPKVDGMDSDVSAHAPGADSRPLRPTCGQPTGIEISRKCCFNHGSSVL